MKEKTFIERHLFAFVLGAIIVGVIYGCILAIFINGMMCHYETYTKNELLLCLLQLVCIQTLCPIIVGMTLFYINERLKYKHEDEIKEKREYELENFPKYIFIVDHYEKDTNKLLYSEEIEAIDGADALDKSCKVIHSVAHLKQN